MNELVVQTLEHIGSVLKRLGDAAIKGDLPGHPFRGNQWSGSVGDLEEAGFSVVDKEAFGRLHETAQKEIIVPLLKLAKDFPGLNKEISSIRVVPKIAGDHAPFQILESGGSKQLQISEEMLGKRFEETMKDTDKAQSNGFLASKGGISGLIEHEAGHVIEKMSYRNKWPGVHEAKIYIKKNPPTAKQLSRYAMKSQDELFAEAFASFRTNQSPNKWQAEFNSRLKKQ